jgi:hypothetical protein
MKKSVNRAFEVIAIAAETAGCDGVASNHHRTHRLRIIPFAGEAFCKVIEAKGYD